MFPLQKWLYLLIVTNECGSSNVAGRRRCEDVYEGPTAYTFVLVNKLTRSMSFPLQWIYPGGKWQHEHCGCGSQKRWHEYSEVILLPTATRPRWLHWLKIILLWWIACVHTDENNFFNNIGKGSSNFQMPSRDGHCAIWIYVNHHSKPIKQNNSLFFRQGTGNITGESITCCCPCSSCLAICPALFR